MSLPTRKPLRQSTKPIARTGIKRTRKAGPRLSRGVGAHCTQKQQGASGGRMCNKLSFREFDRCVLHVADMLARDFVMARDQRTCRRCGWDETQPKRTPKHRLEWAHLYSRRYKLVRHNPLNAMVLCSGCHFWQTNNPLEGEAFFEAEIGEAAWLDLRRRALANEKPDYEAVADSFLEMAA